MNDELAKELLAAMLSLTKAIHADLADRKMERHIANGGGVCREGLTGPYPSNS